VYESIVSISNYRKYAAQLSEDDCRFNRLFSIDTLTTVGVKFLFVVDDFFACSFDEIRSIFHPYSIDNCSNVFRSNSSFVFKQNEVNCCSSF